MLRQMNSNQTSTNHDQIDDATCHLLSLPSEMVKEIILHLPVSSIIRLAKTSSQLKKMLLSDESLMVGKSFWQKKLRDYFPEAMNTVKENYATHFVNAHTRAIRYMRKNSKKLLEANIIIKKDREIVLVAVKGYGWALRYADASLRRDREIVLAAVKQYGSVLQFADAS